MLIADLHRVLRRYDPRYLRALGLVFLLSALASVGVVLRPLPIKLLVEPPAAGGWTDGLEAVIGPERRAFLYVGLILVIELAVLAGRIAAEWRSSSLTERFVRRVRDDLAATLLGGPYHEVASGGAGAVLAAASGDLESVQRMLREVLVATAISVLQLGLMLLVVLTIETWLFWILAIEIAVLALAIGTYAQWRKRRYLAKMALEERLLGLLSGLYHKNLDIRFTGLGSLFLVRLLGLARGLYRLNLMLWRWHGSYHALSDFVIGLSAAVCLVALVLLAGEGTPPIGTFLVFAYYSVLIFPNLSQIGEALPMLTDARAALARIQAQTGQVEARPALAAPAAACGPLPIVFDRVSFLSAAGETILAPLSFTLAPGEHLGLFGDSGTGKTTILMLLLGLARPSAGRITIGGREAEALSLRERKRLFFLARAQPAFLPASAGDNIRRHRAPQPAGLAAVLRYARLDRRFAADPAGLEAAIGDKGEPFSGGEQQRIAIARAFLSDAPYLILDEALSSLDEAAETAILEALLAFHRGRTLIVISHRRSVARLFPRRLILARGAAATLEGEA